MSLLTHLKMLAKAIQVVLVGLLVVGSLLVGIGLTLSHMQGEYLDKQGIIVEEFNCGF